MTSNATIRPSKAVLLMVFAGIAAMFVWSFVYRAANPSLIATVETRGEAPGGQGTGDGAMGGVMAAMQKLKANPDDLGAMEEAAEAFAQAQMWDKALSILEKAYAKDPKEMHILNLYGVTLFRLERPSESAKKFEEMLAIDPNNYQALFNLGAVVKHGLQDPQTARKHFEAVIANPMADPQTKEQARQELQSAP
ncbi:MAG: tetratricopeptide repeat protein [Thermodesulfobacteriota bacterium]